MKARPGFDPGSLVSGVIDLRFDYWWPAALAAVGGVLLACGIAGPPRDRR